MELLILTDMARIILDVDDSGWAEVCLWSCHGKKEEEGDQLQRNKESIINPFI